MKGDCGMTSAISITPASAELTNKGFISDQLWGRLVDRIVKDESVERSVAERIMDQALGFLRLVSIDPTQSYSPSELVDVGWHTFILYTREYAAFCEKVAGCFLHHSPFDEPGVSYGSDNVSLTVEALKRNGFDVDEMLWVGKADCSNCTGGGDGDSCGASGTCGGGGGSGGDGC